MSYVYVSVICHLFYLSSFYPSVNPLPPPSPPALSLPVSPCLCLSLSLSLPMAVVNNQASLREYVATSGDTFACHTGVLLASSGYSLGTLLSPPGHRAAPAPDVSSAETDRPAIASEIPDSFAFVFVISAPSATLGAEYMMNQYLFWMLDLRKLLS